MFFFHSSPSHIHHLYQETAMKAKGPLKTLKFLTRPAGVAQGGEGQSPAVVGL